MQPMLNIAIRAARRAGTIIIRSIEKRQDLHVESKAKNDFVSEVDRQAEACFFNCSQTDIPSIRGITI
ncbi:Inositol monophosphatase, partial [Candidatus Thiomargarita nelsonii]